MELCFVRVEQIGCEQLGQGQEHQGVLYNQLPPNDHQSGLGTNSQATTGHQFHHIIMCELC